MSWLEIKNLAFGTLASGISDTDLSITLGSGEGARFASTTSIGRIFTLSGGEVDNEEIILFDSGSGDTLTVNSGGRGYSGTTALTWSAGAKIEGPLSVEHIAELRNSIENISDYFPSGFIGIFGSTAPSNWLACDGTVYSIATYPALGALLGATFGGNGTTTFGVPDLRGKFPIGTGDDGVLTARALGDVGGAETHTLTESELAAHQHDFSVNSGGGNQSPTTGKTLADSSDTGFIAIYNANTPNTILHADMISAAGAGDAHNNMPPFIGLNFYIKT